MPLSSRGGCWRVAQNRRADVDWSWMSLDPTLYPFVEQLRRNVATFAGEAAALEDDAFLVWHNTEAYHGKWLAYPLLLTKYGPLGVDLAAQQRRCRESMRILRSIPGVVEAVFSRLMPGTHIYRHVDAFRPDEVRCHLGLDVPEQALLRTENDIGVVGVGECRVFDAARDHESANLSEHPRTILICDVRVGDDHERRPDVPAFGQPGVGPARPRPGAYGCAVRGDELLVVVAPDGMFLPGGGLEDDEDAIAGLRRELAEETGFVLESARPFAQATQFVETVGGTVAKLCSFLTCDVREGLTDGVEDDHDAQWVPVETAAAGLTEAASRWAVRRLLDSPEPRAP